jgi:small multidrug resistance family-3 protein
MLGAAILALYGIIPTFQPANFGRVYAAYGGIFIVLSILWGWQIGKITPDKFDLIGGFIALIGVTVIMYWPRVDHGNYATYKEKLR